MPDLTTHIAFMCRSMFSWYRDVPSSDPKIPPYAVTFGPCAPTRGVQNDFACTCRDFVHRKKDTPGAYCKHILAVKGERCGWDSQVSGGLAVKGKGKHAGKMVCPKCGSVCTPYQFAA